MANHTKLLLFIVLAGLAGVLYQSGLIAELTFAGLKARQVELQAWTEANYATALAIYFVVYVISTAVSVPGATVLTLAGGALFGFAVGLGLVSFASTIGATLCFLGSRFFFRDLVARRFARTYESVQANLDKEGLFYLLTLRLIPAVPFFVINLVFGLTRMRPIVFFSVSQIGMLPGTMAYVNAGTRLGQLESPGDVLSARVVLSFVALGLVPWVARLFVSFVRRPRA